MTLKLRHFYEFGPFRLEPEEHLLVSGQQAVAMAPKSFELLVFLVQNHGRLVTKDQIMEAIWSESFVEEANLTVAISAIRKALKEKEGKVQYIETVPKRGYRFTAAVREVEEAPASSLTVAADETVVRFAESPAEPTKRVLDSSAVTEGPLLPNLAQLSSAETGVGARESWTKVKALEDLAEIPGRPSAQLQPRTKWRVWVTAACVAMVAAVVVIGFALRGKREAAHPPIASGPRSLAILPFQSLKRDPDYDFLGFSLADAVITRLGYVSALTVRPSAAVEKYRDQVIEIPKVARELNVDTLLTGRYIRDGENLRITYQMIDVKTDKILGEDSIDLKNDNLLRVQDDVAERIIQGLELNLSAAEAASLKRDEPASPLAYEYYLRGVDLYVRHEFPPAIKMLEKSTSIDPRYALAWAYLGAAYTSDAAFELEGREQYRKAQAAYERALGLQPEQLEAHIFLANLLIDTGKVEQAIPLLREAVKTNPNHADTHWELGYAYRFAGMLPESVAECERARQLDPLVKANGAVLNSYLYLGEYDKFLDSLPEGSDSTFALFYRGFGEYYKKNWERASQDFDRAYALEPTLYTQIGEAFSKSIAHQDAQGLEILRDLESRIAKRGVGDGEATYKIAQAYASLGDKASALRGVRQSIEIGFFCYPYIANDPLLNEVRDEPGFQPLLTLAQQRHEAFKSKFF